MRFDTTWRHIRRSPYQALAALIMTFSTFYVVMIFVMIIYGSNELLRYFESRPKILAYFRDDITLEAINDLKEQLGKTGKVKEVRYISKEEALAIYKKETEDEPRLSEFVFAQTLPASFDVSVTDIRYMKEIAQILKEQPGILRVDHLEDVTDRLIAWTTSTRSVGLVLMGLLAVNLVFLFLFVMSLRAYIHREELQILSLLGASGWFMYQPFLWEALLYGIMAPILAGIATYVTIPYLAGVYQDLLSDILLLPIPLVLFAKFVAVAIGIGMFTATIGSILAVRRYLRV